MNFAGFLELHARSNPHRLALADNRCRLSFAEFDDLASRFAEAMAELGLVRGDRVGIFLPNRVEVAIVLLGCMKAGYLPVPFNSRLRGDDLTRVVGHSDPACIVTTAAALPEFIFTRARSVLTVDEEQRTGGFWTALERMTGHYPSIGVQAGEPANLLYTSGTTATPKAAIHTHGMRIAIAGAMADSFRLSQTDIALAVSPLFHTSGMSVLSNAIFVGCPCIMVEKWDLDDFLRVVESERVTFMHMIATLIVDVATADEVRFAQLTHRMRMTWGGGHKVDPAVLEQFEQRMGGVLLQGYSRTEGGLTYNRLPPMERRFDHNGYENFNSSRVAIFDPDTHAPVPVGETGLIAVQGDGVSPGYWDGDFVRRPKLIDNVWQPTGDIGFLDDAGALHFIGRLDYMIKTGGENVFPSEVEAVLLALDQVTDAVVVGIDDTRFGQRVCAIVVPSRAGASADEIITACRRSLSGFKIPKTILFQDHLPRLGNSKVDIKACVALVEASLEPHPDASSRRNTPSVRDGVAQ
ncbi:acyl--CoA ligase [Sphingomonas sp. CGMCC 1.13654]|uniref:Acyl--CoA ligase n=1 Tax=Sphingomonas chungangi TaxID=2683589 RepID=A0A838LC07_9SPHN|nr:class I adenylate-forming enzyme family protein [Sphingomonas chungangi]MBA2936557.1 acyl--CoA ligase [Sphingomonas chungangi]MVW55942.1 AMP-binding protein [Sphingomonas chungangi]